MNRIARVFLIIACSITTLAACGKPKAEECKKAIANIREVYRTAGMDFGVSPEAAVRSCRGSASNESVRCMLEAKTMEDLRECEGEVPVEEPAPQDDQGAENEPEATNPPPATPPAQDQDSPPAPQPTGDATAAATAAE